MTYPPQQPHQGQPYGQPQFGQQPPYPPQVPYGQPQQYPTGGYPVQPPHVQQMPVVQQVSVNVQQGGHPRRAVTKPAWTLGDIMWLVFTAGLALPYVWLRRRRRTTVTRYR